MKHRVQALLMTTGSESPSITTKSESYVISGQKIVVSDLGGGWREEINLKYVSHVRCDSVSGPHLAVGGILGLLGMVVLVLAQERFFLSYKVALSGLGVILLLVGIVLIVLKKSTSMLKITLTGVNQPLKYELKDVSNKKIQEFVSRILPAREVV